MLAGRVRELNENVEYLEKDANFSRAITEKSPENTVIFTMGAGDIYKLVN
jgi:UDP-N-acetylmuramate-alanine ligase